MALEVSTLLSRGGFIATASMVVASKKVDGLHIGKQGNIRTERMLDFIRRAEGLVVVYILCCLLHHNVSQTELLVRLWPRVCSSSEAPVIATEVHSSYAAAAAILPEERRASSFSLH